MDNKKKKNNKNNNNMVHGFKVFNPDWTCREKQYTCPGIFEEEGKLEVCGHGIHFCQTAADCFNYYRFNSENKIAEVIAYGKVKTDGVKSCTNKLEIVREIPWQELLTIVNIGKNCTGLRNTGGRNSGNCNSGNWNSGNCNSGNCNSGYWNTGNYNSGYHNSGNYNSGDWNSGDCNSGERNSGNHNSGDWNNGNHNSGNCNSGNRNSGDWNKTCFSNGCFNTESPKIFLFNKLSDWTYQDWLDSDARCLLMDCPSNVLAWVCNDDMTDEEKEQHPEYSVICGFLKHVKKEIERQMWWNALSKNEKEIIKSIPNFNAEIFFQCTGIKVEDLAK